MYRQMAYSPVMCDSRIPCVEATSSDEREQSALENDAERLTRLVSMDLEPGVSDQFEPNVTLYRSREKSGGNKSRNAAERSCRHTDKSSSGYVPELQYGAMGRHEDYLRQDTRPVPFVSIKVRRYVRLEGTRLSLAKAPDGEVIWSFDIAGAHVQTYDEDRKISVWLTDSMRRRRRVIVLVGTDTKQYVRWSFWIRRASKSVLELHYRMVHLC